MNKDLHAAMVALFDKAKSENPETSIELSLRVGAEQNVIVNTEPQPKKTKTTKESR